MAGDVRVRLKAHELSILRAALRLRQASWRAERSRAAHQGDTAGVERCGLVLEVMGEIAAKLDMAAQRGEELVP